MLGAVVVLALLFGVLRPALRQIAGPPKALPGPDEDPLRAGVELTLRELTRATEASGLSTVAPAPGHAFNPEHHQAISQADANGAAPGSVLQVFQKGYLLGGRLLRPALVVVARHD